MPTAATHVTIVERLAASDPRFATVLGSPTLQSVLNAGGAPIDDDSPTAKLMRYTCLGAMGPDFLYALADYGSGIQELESYLTQVAGAFHGIGDLVEGLNTLIDGAVSQLTRGVLDALQTTTGLLNGVLKDWVLSELVDNGLNLWPGFMPRREIDDPRQGKPGQADTSWFWADYLHYVRTGQFVERLIERAAGDPMLTAYALGYATHYIVDTVGHPYVNTVVGSPWRMYWQRHHLVENFIDAFVWDAWHVPVPPPTGPTQSELPLDALDDVSGPHPNPGAGAPLTFARINDHINIGIIASPDPLANAIESVAQAIAAAETQLNLTAVPTLEPPNDAEFTAWTNYFADTLQDVYGSTNPNGPDHPNNLTTNGGFPMPDDIAAAYMVFRLLMSISTEEDVTSPGPPPDITADAEQAIQQLIQSVQNAVAQIGPPPPLPSGGQFNIDAALKAIEQLAEWAVNAAAVSAATVWSTIDGIANLTAQGAADLVKFGLWLISTQLFAAYRHVRDVLVLNAYEPPFTDEIDGSLGGQPLEMLWKTMGSLPNYPAEMIAAETPKTGNSYAPNVAPSAPAEKAQFSSGASPYEGVHGAGHASASVLATPSAFIGNPTDAMPDDMFSADGPVPFNTQTNSFEDVERNFGSAMANCAHLLSEFVNGGGKLPASFMFPDYNLDGDRSYAWPCWDVRPGTGLDPLTAAATNPPAAPVSAMPIH